MPSNFHRHLHLGLWRSHGVLHKGPSPEPLILEAKLRFGMDLSAVQDTAAGCVAFGPGDPWIMWVQDPDNVGTLAHEAFHAASGLLHSRGMRLCPDSEEAFAYTITAIVEEFTKKKGWARISERSLSHARKKASTLTPIVPTNNTHTISSAMSDVWRVGDGKLVSSLR